MPTRSTRNRTQRHQGKRVCACLCVALLLFMLCVLAYVFLLTLRVSVRVCVWSPTRARRHFALLSYSAETSKSPAWDGDVTFFQIQCVSFCVEVLNGVCNEYESTNKELTVFMITTSISKRLYLPLLREIFFRYQIHSGARTHTRIHTHTHTHTHTTQACVRTGDQS